MTQDRDQMRAEFEAWARSFGTWDVQRDDEPIFGVQSYTEMEVSIAWLAWRAAQPKREPIKVTPEMRTTFRQAFREGGFWCDRLDYALDRMMEVTHHNIGGKA